MTEQTMPLTPETANMQRGRGLKKGRCYDDPGAKWLGELSKAALLDLCVDLLRAASGSCDDPISIEAAREAAGPVLTMRGDRAPAVQPWMEPRE